MQLNIHTEPPRSEIGVVGRFDAHETAGFRKAVDALVAGPAPDLRLDLSQVAFLDSSALAEIVRAMKLARSAGGDLVLTAVSVPVRVILELTGIERALRIVDADDTDPALRARESAAS